MEKLPPIEQLRGRPIGRVLIKMGLLTREKVHQCLEVQKQRSKQAHKNVPLGEIFVELGLINEKQLQVALAAQRGMENINLNEITIPPDVLDKVPGQMAKTYRALPVEYKKETNELVVAVDKADNFREKTTLARYWE
jgi:type IV pilus assembly protein PilB